MLEESCRLSVVYIVVVVASCHLRACGGICCHRLGALPGCAGGFLPLSSWSFVVRGDFYHLAALFLMNARQTLSCDVKLAYPMSEFYKMNVSSGMEALEIDSIPPHDVGSRIERSLTALES